MISDTELIAMQARHAQAAPVCCHTAPCEKARLLNSLTDARAALRARQVLIRRLAEALENAQSTFDWYCVEYEECRRVAELLSDPMVVAARLMS